MKNLSNQAKEQLKEMIVDAINDNRLNDSHISEIHHEIFNTDYFIIGRYEAEEWLKDNYGIFLAIDRIKEYEQDNFGEITTDIGESEKVCNMLVYILGEELLSGCDFIQKNWDKTFSEDDKEELIEEIENL